MGAKGSKTFWGMDSEYKATGRFAENDTFTFGFANNHGERHFFDRPNDVWKFLIERRFRRLVVWCMAPEFGSLASWAIINASRKDLARFAYISEGSAQQPYHFRIPRGEHFTVVHDIQGFFKNSRWKGMRLAPLANVAKFLSEFYGDPSIYKPESPELLAMFEEQRAPRTQREWDLLHERVMQDAYVTAGAAEYLQEELMRHLMPKPNLYRYRSWGGVARKVFKFPKTNIHMRKDVFVQNAHLLIRDSSFAGRSECFSTGAVPPCFYMDVSSLYPLCVTSTNALMIKDVEWMTDEELDAIRKPSDVYPYAWLAGTFETRGPDDLWGLPMRSGERNYYVTGRVTGFYNSLDLQASHAEIIGDLDLGLKPVFRREREMHEKYANYLLKKLKKGFRSEVERTAAKEVLNASYGSLGMTHPRPSIRSNFPAYSVVLAQSRWLMSKIFDMAPKPIHYMDTDSIFVERKTLQGKIMDLTDLEGRISLPLILEEKGFGETPKIFRSKHYYLNEDNYGFHAVVIDLDDWKRIVTTLPTADVVRRQIRGTLLTRSKRAKELQIGRWFTVHLSVTLDRLRTIFHADDKRCRESYDSYDLVRQGKWIPSRSWTKKEFTRHIQKEELKDTFTGLPSGIHRNRLFLRKWLKEYAREDQGIKCSIEWLAGQPSLETILLLRKLFKSENLNGG